jgi:UDP-N-acetylglucosamine 2-epimerase (non-hydrolysing)
MAPVLIELAKRKEIERSLLAVTAQHRELLDQTLEIFNLQPDLDLDIMKRGQSLEYVTTAALEGLTRWFEIVKPDVVLVHGDTTTTFTAALAAFYLGIKVGHVEAGLRTGNRFLPYPEEMNRRLTDELASIFFAPTQLAKKRLLEREIPECDVFVTGNTVVDALLDIAARPHEFTNAAVAGFLKRDGCFRILFTMHRRESWGEPMRAVLLALRKFVQAHPYVSVVFPVHPNPAVREPADEILSGLPSVFLTNALDYIDFVHLMKRCDLIVSDSGGIQEEAPSFGKYTLVMRVATERPEVVDAGFAEVGCHVPSALIAALERVVQLVRAGIVPPADKRNPVGDGRAAARTVDFLLYKFGLTDSPGREFGV